MSKPPERSWMLATLIGSSAQALEPSVPAATAAAGPCKKLLRLTFIAVLLLVVADAPRDQIFFKTNAPIPRCGRRILWFSTGSGHQRERSTPRRRLAILQGPRHRLVNIAPIVIRSRLFFGLTDESKRNQNQFTEVVLLAEALVNELLSYVFSPLREGDIALYRGSGNGLAPILLVAAEETLLGSVERLEHEYALKGELDAGWAARPVALTYYNDRMALVLEDPGGAPLDRLLGRPLEISHFLRIAIPLAGVLRQVHERGLIHKDIKPANILVDAASGGVWLTGVGIASRLAREHQPPAPPEVIAGDVALLALD